MQFVIDNFSEGLAPPQQPLDIPLWLEARAIPAVSAAVRGRESLARYILFEAPRAGDDRAPTPCGGENLAITKGSVILQTSVFD